MFKKVTDKESLCSHRSMATDMELTKLGLGGSWVTDDIKSSISFLMLKEWRQQDQLAEAYSSGATMATCERLKKAIKKTKTRIENHPDLPVLDPERLRRANACE